MKTRLVISLITLFLSIPSQAKPMEYLDQHYGSNEREIFDLWLPDAVEPAPLVIFIHGGGWAAGSKDEMRKQTSIIQKYNHAGIAVAAINYRFLSQAPLQTIMREDIAGFVQFMRSNAEKYHLNKALVLPYGVSAGGSASLWLATHDDIAQPQSQNPILRESSRVTAAGHLNGQISYDYMVWYQFYGKPSTDRFVGNDTWQRYHLKSFDDLFTDKGKAIRKDMDMYGNLTSDDPPLLFWNNLDDHPEVDMNHFVHSPRHAKLLSEKANELKIQTQTMIAADGTHIGNPHQDAQDFFSKILKTYGYKIKKDKPKQPSDETLSLNK